MQRRIGRASYLVSLAGAYRLSALNGDVGTPPGHGHSCRLAPHAATCSLASPNSATADLIRRRAVVPSVLRLLSWLAFSAAGRWLGAVSGRLAAVCPSSSQLNPAARPLPAAVGPAPQGFCGLRVGRRRCGLWGNVLRHGSVPRLRLVGMTTLRGAHRRDVLFERVTTLSALSRSLTKTGE